MENKQKASGLSAMPRKSLLSLYGYGKIWLIYYLLPVMNNSVILFKNKEKTGILMEFMLR